MENTQMWDLTDGYRRQRRDSGLELRDAVHDIAIKREKKSTAWVEGVRLNNNDPNEQERRTTLIGWMLKTTDKHRLHGRDVAGVCIVLALKIEQSGGDAMHIPQFEDVMVDLDLELLALQSLQWKLIVPTSYTFLSLYSDRWWVPQHAFQRAVCLLKHVLVYVDSQVFNASTLALVCLVLVKEAGDLPTPCIRIMEWEMLQESWQTRWREDEFSEAIHRFRRCCRRRDQNFQITFSTQEAQVMPLLTSNDGFSTTTYASSSEAFERSDEGS